MALTTYAETALLSALLGQSTFTSPTTVYLALFTTATGDDGSGTEVTGGSYARQPITFDAVAEGAAMSNAAVVFADMPASLSTHAAMFDAATGGNMLLHGPLTPNQNLIAGATLTLTTGAVLASLE